MKRQAVMAGVRLNRQTMTVIRPLIGLFLIYLVIFLFAPTFRSWPAFSNVLENASVLFVMCTGMTVALIGGCLDLSVGSTYALASVVLGQLLMAKYPVPVAITGALIAGAICGVVNGIILVKTGIPPLIATLGTQLAFRGVANMIGAASNMSHFPQSFDDLGAGFWGPMIICVISFALTWFFLNKTKTGFHSFAIGGNEEVARLAGIPVNRGKIIFYMISGLAAALAGILYTARVDMAQVNRGVGMELWAIAGVVIGGTSAFGGVGSVTTTVIGVLIISVLQAGMIHLHVEAFMQQVVVGAVIILAVWLDFWQRRRALRA